MSPEQTNPSNGLFDGDKPDFSYRKCNTEEELIQYLKELIEYPKHTYNTTGYAVTKALLAVEMFMAHRLGTTGFQHGYAQLAFMQETKGSKTGVAVIDFDQLLYPQYDLLQKVHSWIEEHKKSDVLKNHAKELIAKIDPTFPPHPDVEKRWREIANA